MHIAGMTDMFFAIESNLTTDISSCCYKLVIDEDIKWNLTRDKSENIMYIKISHENTSSAHL